MPDIELETELPTYLLTPFLPKVLVRHNSGRIQALPCLWLGCRIQSSQNLKKKTYILKIVSAFLHLHLRQDFFMESNNINLDLNQLSDIFLLFMRICLVAKILRFIKSLQTLLIIEQN